MLSEIIWKRLKNRQRYIQKDWRHRRNPHNYAVLAKGRQNSGRAQLEVLADRVN